MKRLTMLLMNDILFMLNNKQTSTITLQETAQETTRHSACCLANPEPFSLGGSMGFGKGKKHSGETKRKMSESRKGSKNSHWKGGIKIDDRGYVFIHKPEHPFCVKNYIRRSRLIIELQIGRYLKSEEICHHINKIKDDDRIENLMAFISHSAHRKFHVASNKVEQFEIIFDGRLIK